MDTKTTVKIETISCEPTTHEFENFLYYRFKERIEQLGCDDHVFALLEEDIKKVFTFFFWAICKIDTHNISMLDLKEIIPAVQCDGENGYNVQEDLELIFIECIPEWMENPYKS